MPQPNPVEKSAVDLVHDFEMSRQDASEQADRPFLERLGKQGVVRVPHGLSRDVPCRFPVHAMVVKEDADQLGDRERGVCVVELNRVLLVEARNVRRRLQVDADHVLQRAAHKKVLLLKTQLFSLKSGVVRVEHLADRLGGDFLLDRAIVVTDVERLEIE